MKSISLSEFIKRFLHPTIDLEPKKEYLITETGKTVFEEERRRLEELLKNAALFDNN